MGFLDKILSIQAGSFSGKKAIVHNWRTTVEPPDYEDLEVLPFQDPHHYSDSEADDQELSESIGDKPDDHLVETPKFVRATAHISQIQREPLVMNAYDYSNVSISPWRTTFETSPSAGGHVGNGSYTIKRAQYDSHGGVVYDLSDDDDGEGIHFTFGHACCLTT
jgi:hypothetical protein